MQAQLGRAVDPALQPGRHAAARVAQCSNRAQFSRHLQGGALLCQFHERLGEPAARWQCTGYSRRMGLCSSS